MKDVREHVWAICEAFDKDPNLIAKIEITPETVTFTEYMEPKQQGADGPLTVIDMKLWRP